MGNRTIIIGYGNRDRADDGVAFFIVNVLRRRRGIALLDEGDTGLDDLNDHADSIFIPQLMPEILERLTGYDRIIFVDAHVSPDTEDINSTPVLPEYSASSFTHHMTPSAFLAFLESLYHCRPEAYVVSVLGHEFDFRRTLSTRVQALVQTAADTILELMDR